MVSHAPKGYVCPFCLVANGIENEQVQSTQNDIIYQDFFITAFIAAGGWEKNKGHVLIIPNQHYENLYELPAELSAKIHDFEKAVAIALKKVYHCDGVSSRQHNEPSGNQEVWHYHLHVFPRYENDHLYTEHRQPIDPNERADYAKRLRKYFQDNPYKPYKKPALLCGASVILYKDGKILLQQRKDNLCWGYHGGALELGEEVEEAAKRELFEETGLHANSLTLFGVFSGPQLHHIYPDGYEVYIMDAVYLCNDFSGTMQMQEEECIDLRWFAFDQIPQRLSPPIEPGLKKFLAMQGIPL